MMEPIARWTRRMRGVVVVVLVSLPVLGPARAQAPRPVPYPVFSTPQFEQALEKGTRTETGQPGPAYWTNRADYTIRATLSPDSKQLRGEATVVYHNQSPDTLWNVAVHLRQNLHREGAIRNRPVQVTGGMHLASVAYEDRPLIERRPGRERRPGYVVDGTVMYVTLPEPILPGTSASFAFAWSFEVPEAGAPRMGQDGEVFFLAYWYPQFAVYDDVNGWKADPYMGNGEFYMGYGTYDVHLTVPEGWLVGATGILQNPEDVLSEQTRARLSMLDDTHENGAVIHVVEEGDRVAGRSTATSPTGMLTWHFRAEDVRDFAFGASDRYVWDAATARVGDRDGDGRADVAQIHAFYRPGTSSWERSAEFARFSIEHLSEMIMPYPYPHMTTIEGLIGGGMEFPMITLIGGNRTDETLFSVTYHEISHMWFPMIVGQDEKQYTWMDEGLTSFNTNEGVAAFWNIDAWDPGRQSYYFIAGSGREVESMRHADEYPVGSPARVIASYSKPAVTLHALRGLVGQERFLEAYREYARRWAYKHPQPYDLFNTFEDVLGQDLDWLWTSMFYTTWTLDQAVAAVEETGGGVRVTVRDQGLVPMPAPVRVTYADGAVAEATVPVDVWLRGETVTTLRFDPGTVARIEIDPERYLPDVDRSNNVWER
ncbi:MAG: peptidase [Rhodothermaceae bacterium]|nr:MAG: peptidase [Rhodothermaceae bacterium]